MAAQSGRTAICGAPRGGAEARARINPSAPCSQRPLIAPWKLPLNARHVLQATPGPASKLVRLAGATEREAFAVPAMPRARPRATLAQLAREVLTLQALPYEARAAAVDSWLRRARCLGNAQYHECVQLAVSLLTRRAAKVRNRAAHMRALLRSLRMLH